MTLTPAERGAVLLVVGLLALGTLWDMRPVRFRGASSMAAPRDARIREVVVTPSAAVDLGPPRSPASRLDLNRATRQDLDALPGVGPVLAGRILEQRQRQGEFHDVRDLRAVRGIGAKLYARLEPMVEVRRGPRGP